MSQHQLDFLKRIGRYLWRLVIIDNAFRVGSYLLGVSVMLLLVARVFNISFLTESYLLLLSPLIGLLVGLVAGLFNKPSMADISLVADNKLGLNNYLATAYECSSRPVSNQVEGALVSDMARQGGRLTEGFFFKNNRRYLYLFMVLAGVFMVIWFMPVVSSMPADKTQSPGSLSVRENRLITISQGLSEVKGKIQEDYLVQEFIRDIEILLADMRKNPQDKTVLVERINKFLQ